MKRNGFTFWEAVFVLGLLLLLAAILFPVFAPSRGGCTLRPSCQTHLKRIGLGIMLYANDFDRTHPSVESRSSMSYGWADAIYPYIEDHRTYWCWRVTEDNYRFSSRSQGKPDQRGYTDYWLNSRAAGIDSRNIPFPARTILGGEGNDGRDITDARYNLAALPQSWIQDRNSPFHRHAGTFTLLFCDGHVKPFVGDRIGDTATTTASPVTRDPTFAVK